MIRDFLSVAGSCALVLLVLFSMLLFTFYLIGQTECTATTPRNGCIHPQHELVVLKGAAMCICPDKPLPRVVSE